MAELNIINDYKLTSSGKKVMPKAADFKLTWLHGTIHVLPFTETRKIKET